MIRLAPVVALVALSAAVPARAHHGVATVNAVGSEGPGAPLETTSPLPLGMGTLLAMVKTEYVPFRQFAFAAPENKTFSSFNMVAVGYGVTPWLSAYAVQPLAVKSQDAVGRNASLGDPTLMLALGFKHDRGLRLLPERESLDDLADWHFSAWASTTLPVASTTRRDRGGERFAPDMQNGFGTPSPAAGLAVMKQLSERLTWVADASYQHFFAHDYPETRYRFGGETRVNSGLAWRLHASGAFRADLSAELNGLHLQRDRERTDGGAMEPLRSSGGAIVYAGGGARLTYGAVSLALGARRAALKDLNEGSDQQGSEGLERVRATATLSWSRAL